MTERIPTPNMSDILREEFMEPLDITAYQLAKSIGVPTSRIQDILHGRRKISLDTSLRLGKFFGVSDKYFFDIQNDIDMRDLKRNIAGELEKIITYKVATL